MEISMFDIIVYFLGIPAVVVAITMGINKLDNYMSKTDL